MHRCTFVAPAPGAAPFDTRAHTARRADSPGLHMSTHRAPACPICEGEGVLLGPLGPRTWFRCRQCGMDCSRKRRPARRTVRGTGAPAADTHARPSAGGESAP